MHRNIKKFILIVAFYFIYTQNIVTLEAKDNTLLLNKSPINIESSSLEIFDDKKIAIFEGQVRVNQKDITISSNRLELSYAFNSMSEDISVKKIVCTGNVLIEFDNQSVTSESAEYNLKDNQIILQNDVIISKDEGNAIKAEKVIIDLDTMRIKMDSSERVQAFITPPNK
jgi:lipopolysaccharide transport protein LptA